MRVATYATYRNKFHAKMPAAPMTTVITTSSIHKQPAAFPDNQLAGQQCLHRFPIIAGACGQLVQHRPGRMLADFDHICGSYSVPLMMMVPQDSQFKSIGDVVDYAKQNPKMLAYGTSGQGTLLHIAMEMLMKQAGRSRQPSGAA